MILASKLENGRLNKLYLEAVAMTIHVAKRVQTLQYLEVLLGFATQNTLTVPYVSRLLYGVARFAQLARSR